MLVLLTHVDPTAVDAVPVTMDDGYSTEDSVMLDRDASPLGVSLTVWPSSPGPCRCGCWRTTPAT